MAMQARHRGVQFCGPYLWQWRQIDQLGAATSPRYPRPQLGKGPTPALSPLRLSRIFLSTKIIMRIPLRAFRILMSRISDKRFSLTGRYGRAKIEILDLPVAG